MTEKGRILETEMLKEVEALIFDMDGTLLDSMWIWPSVDEEYLRKYKLDKPEGFLEGMEGMSFVEAARYFLHKFPILSFTEEEVMREWTEMTLEKYKREVKLKEGAYEFITAMRARGKKVGIATSSTRELVGAALSSLQVAELFDSVRTASEVGAGKPSPDVYLKVSEDMGVEPQKCLVFEDIPMGILAGKNAGMRVCGVDDAFSRPQELKKKELADYYIQSFHDIINGTYEVLG